MSRNELKFYMKYFIVHLEILVFQIVVANMGIFLGLNLAKCKYLAIML